jgi:hypothetical protein
VALVVTVAMIVMPVQQAQFQVVAEVVQNKLTLEQVPMGE